MQRDTKNKLKAWVCLLGTCLLTLMAAEITFLLLLWHPFMKEGTGLKGINLLIMLAWIYGSVRVWQYVVKRHTRWLDIIDGKPTDPQKGAEE